MTLQQYIDNINQRYLLGNATEHTFRGDLQQLLGSLVPEISATNEPKRQSCGAPDYILSKKGIDIGFIEAKDIGDKDLDGKNKSGHKEQFDRYKASLNNLIFTDYIDFHLYRDGIFITKIAIAEIQFPFASGVATRQAKFPSAGGVSAGRGGKIVALPQNFERFENLIKVFCTHIGQTIKSPKKLAEMMAGKARLLSDVIEKALLSDETHNEDSTLKEQMLAFRDILIHDITPKGFADVYAQTIAYGLFAARLHDPTLDTFSRQEAAELIPKSNPFLRKLFGYIAGPDIDDRIKWIVDNLTEIFLACNVEDILKNYGKTTKTEDPIIHFYETFLSEYDPKLRKARGVWYTPAPVVNFIVRAVDDILKTEFDLPQGLADTSKTKIKVNTQMPDKNFKSGYKQVEKEVHKVQILDPATGTGTFLAEVIKSIHKKFKGQEGIWSSYVENNLLPRLNGFELLMASYAMAHLQIDLLLKETGYKKTTPPYGHPSNGGEQRTRVYLTNSLEEYHPDTGTLFANWLSSEANEANHIKRDTPVMCIMGNPPYSGESANKGEWIMSLMEDYKKEPGGKEKLKERNPKWINDDYVKFLRYGQHFIEKNGSGILAFINPHGFLDNPTFRGMRWHLLKTYDKIYTIDLHGNSKKKEVCPDGSADQNVFDIMQGVSINIFVKTGKKKIPAAGVVSEVQAKFPAAGSVTTAQAKFPSVGGVSVGRGGKLAQVFHYDLYGKRDFKYDFLSKNSLKTIAYKELPNIAPNYFFVPKDFEAQKSYDKGFKINDLFILNSVGIVTSKDAILINKSKNELIRNIEEYYKIQVDENIIKAISYRPFDNKFIYYDVKLIERAREKSMQHFLKGDNIGLVTARQCTSDWRYVFITKLIGEFNLTSTAGRFGSGSYFPLYLYPETNGQQSLAKKTTPTPPKEGNRIPNLNTEIVNKIAQKLGLTFTNEKENGNVCFANNNDELQNAYKQNFAPIDLLDYIYAVLHSPTYRDKYKEFLKIDFPKVPYPKNTDTFWQLVKLGGEIRQIHLLESKVVENYITSYPQDGDNMVVKPRYINSSPLEGCPQDSVNSPPLEGYSQDSVNSPPMEGCPQDGVVEIFINNTKITLNPKLELPYNAHLKERAKKLRQAKNLPEVLFWMQVHKKKFHKIDFDRQRVIGNYIVDFYVKKLGLVIEIDGSSHDGKEKYDAEREAYLISEGLKVYRIQVVDVMKNMSSVLIDLENYIIENYGNLEKSKRFFSHSEKPPRLLGTPPKEGNLGKVYINDTQYFADVPLVAWEFYIGGYQPAQKWLKDRKGRILTFEDILHYQKIIVALTETNRLMKVIDKIKIE